MGLRLPPDKRRRRTFQLLPEKLETRSLLSGYSPTDIEQFYLEELDDARFNPAAYGVSRDVDLSSVPPSQPLAMNPLLVESARLHSQDMIAQDYFSHTTPEGVGPEQRIEATGFDLTGYAESIEYNSNPTASDVPFPADYAALGHRLQPHRPDRRPGRSGPRPPRHAPRTSEDNCCWIGKSASASHRRTSTSGSFIYRKTDTTIDIGGTPDTDPFITGVVFDDTTGNGEYEPGEGLGGVTITVSNVGTTTTIDAGGYSLQVPPGIYTVTASGGGLPSPITRTVVVQNDNMRLNFDENPNGATLSADVNGTVSGLLGSFAAIAARRYGRQLQRPDRLGRRQRLVRDLDSRGQRHLRC